MAPDSFDRARQAGKQPLLAPGDIVCARLRPRFPDDLRRVFIGTIKAYQDGVARVDGRSWVFNTRTGIYEPKKDRRERLIPIASGEYTINVLPRTTRVDKIRYVLSSERQLVLTDGGSLVMDVSEYRVRST